MKKIRKLFFVVLLILGGFFIWLRRFGGRLEQKAINPKSSAVAEVRLNMLAAATDTDTIFVKLYPNMMHFGDVVFQASTYGGGVHITWQDRSHLLICLEHPNRLVIYRKLKNWKGIVIVYQSE